jgi:nitroreductase
MFFNLLKARRSIRKFQDRAIEKEKLDILLKSALLAPSSRAKRPWEFISVIDKELLKRISQCRDHGSQFLERAPLGIVVIADPDACDVWIEDASIAAIIIHLTAQSIGLGSCWIQIRERMHTHNETSEEYIKGILGIPANYRIESIVGIGYPAEVKKPYDESKLLYQKLHLNKFGVKL